MIQHLKAAPHIFPWWLHLANLTQERFILRAKTLINQWCAATTLKRLNLNPYSKLTFQPSISKPAVLNRVAKLFADHPYLIEGFGVFLPPPQEPPRGYFSRALPSRPVYRPQNATADNDDDGASKTTAVLSDNIRPKLPDEIDGRKLWKRRPRSPEEDEDSGLDSDEVEKDC